MLLLLLLLLLLLMLRFLYSSTVGSEPVLIPGPGISIGAARVGGRRLDGEAQNQLRRHIGLPRPVSFLLLVFLLPESEGGECSSFLLSAEQRSEQSRAST